MLTHDLALVRPELILSLGAIALMMLGAFRREDTFRLASLLAIGLLIVAGACVLAGGDGLAFGGLLVMDGFGRFMKVLALFGSALSLGLSLSYLEREDAGRFEYPVLVVFATLGMLLMISANDLIALYLGLELQSLALYVVAAFRRDTVRSTEAGLKYFVLGALSSGMLLYGASLIYGFAGTTSFTGLAALLTAGTVPSTGIVVGIVFLAAGLAFKVSAVPFHMWTPDVYEGAPTPVTAFFAAAPKIAAIALFVRVMVGPFGGLINSWRQIVLFISIASMLFGALAAINQTNIKRLMAYSSIGNVGYALVGLAAGTKVGVSGLMIYMAIYVVMTIGTFGVILAMRRDGKLVEGIADLAGFSRSHPLLAVALALLMFSMSGIPPLAGFFGKLYVFRAAIEARLYGLAVIGMLSSVIAAFYYLKIVKIMYFDEPTRALDRPAERDLTIIVGALALAILLFFLFPTSLITGAESAAATLFPRMNREPALPTGYRLVRYDRLGSTNDEARDLAAAGAREGTVVWALEQSAGRGRRGRSWASPPGNLYASLVLRPRVLPATAAELALLTSVALAETLEGLVPIPHELRIKWPNDLLIGKAKVSGILPEASLGPDGMVDWLVLGIGVNVASAPRDTPYPATALQLAGARTSAGEVLERLMARLDSWLVRWRAEGFAPARAAWLARAHPVGEILEVRLERERIAGRFAGLDPAGALLLTCPSGETRAIAAGDVFFPRP